MSQINFLPASFLKHRRRQNRRPIEFAIIGGTAVALVALWLYAGGPDTTLAHTAEGLDEQLARVQQQQADHAQLLREREHLQRKLLVARETQQPIRVTQVLARLSEHASEPIRLVGFELVAERPAPDPVPDPSAKPKKVVASGNATPAPPREPHTMRITLAGLSPSDEEIVSFIRALDRDPVFSEVALRNSRVTQTRTHIAREFQLDLVIDLDRRFVAIPQQEQPDAD